MHARRSAGGDWSFAQAQSVQVRLNPVEAKELARRVLRAFTVRLLLNSC
jgi:hypothetical protein